MIYLSLTCPSFGFLERGNSKEKCLGERPFISSFSRPQPTLISSTTNKPTVRVVHLEKTGWLQLLSSGPAGIFSWFSQRKGTLLLARDHASLGNKPRYEYPQGKKSTVLSIHRVSTFQRWRLLSNIEQVPSSDSTARDFRRSSDTLSLLITSSLDQAVFQAFDFNPNSVLRAQIFWDLSPNEKRDQSWVLLTLITLCFCCSSRDTTKMLSNPKGWAKQGPNIICLYKRHHKTLKDVPQSTELEITHP